MKFLKHFILLASVFMMGSGVLFAQGDRCSSIQPFCAGTSSFVFPNSNSASGDIATAETGPNYRCLERQPYPAWFYLQIEESGKLDFIIRQTRNADGSGETLDVDFIAWGPFSEGDDLCSSSSLSSSRIVGCSYSPATVENLVINNAQAGQVYVVLITNYSEMPGFISLEQTNLGEPSSGTTDCSIVNILGDDIAKCDSSPVVLKASNVIASRYRYSVFNETTNSFDLLSNQTSPEFTVTASGLYQVVAVNETTGLELDDEILIEYFDVPVATKPNDLLGCSNERTAIFALSEVTDELTQSSIPDNSIFSANFYTSQQNLDSGTLIENPSTFEGVNGQTIIATITDDRTGCVSNQVDFKLNISPVPIVDLPEITAFCVDLNGELLNPESVGADLGSEYIYEWNIPNDPDGDGVQNPILTFTEAPEITDLTLTITNEKTGCASTFNSKINYFSAPKDVEISISGSDFEDGYVVTATASGFVDATPTFEYQLDNGPWQQQAVFTKVVPGIHSVTAREINGCGMATSESFRLIGYSRFFTPNADGYNDSWTILSDESISVSLILIYDRYGKLIKQLDPRGQGWDGTYNGKTMPADDYWFVVNIKETNSGEVSEYRGHFTLKR